MSKGKHAEALIIAALKQVEGRATEGEGWKLASAAHALRLAIQVPGFG